MTTIAIDHKMIAADSRATRGSELRADEVKIRPAHGRLYAVSGSAAMFAALIAWHHAGADPATVPGKDQEDLSWTLIVVDPLAEHPMTFSSECPYPEWIDLPSTFGSGRTYAQALLDKGCTPIEAVAGAAKRDVYTGGPVIAYDLATMLPIDTEADGKKADIAAALERTAEKVRTEGPSNGQFAPEMQTPRLC